jgi:hypothetical protein
VRLLLLELGDRRAVEGLARLQHHASGLGDQVLACLVIGEVRFVVPDRPLDLAVRGLDEAVAIDAAVRGQGTDQADVRPFRRLDRADPTVVAVVDVTDVEPGTLSREATRDRGRSGAAST